MTKNDLIKVFQESADNYRYAWGIKVFEKELSLKPEFKNSEEILLKLGMLYDHLAVFKDSKTRLILERKAVKIYKKVLKLNPKSALALWGIGRVFWHRKSKKAIPYAIRAYRLARSGLFAQNVGAVYMSLNKFNEAEPWLLKGQNKDPRNWAMYLNLVSFYEKIGNIKKAKLYAKKLKLLFSKEKPQVKKTKWGKQVLAMINRLDP